MIDRIVAVVPAYNEEKTIGDTLDALESQSLPLSGIVVVDNGSTDKTSDIVHAYQARRNGDGIIHLVQESEKGTGIASNTGFRFAIDELGADIVSRTDADTIPSDDWNDEIAQYFRDHPRKQLVSGPSFARKDEFYRGGDRILWSLLRKAYRIGNVAVAGSLFPYKFAVGHNMAVRADAFDEVGGFTHSSIAEKDEDVELSKRINSRFGFSALGYEPDIKVWTSMRRIRKLGYLGLAPYYWNPATPPSQERRLKMTDGEVDIR